VSGWFLDLFVSVFLAILFLQSGLDKVFDRKGNLEWLTGHFAASPLASMVPMMLSVITLVELAAGAASAVGAAAIAWTGATTIAFWGAVLSAAALLMLFFGQRMAKDYEGAAVLVNYFLASLAAIHLLAA
jgi:hypothetical protein